MKKVLLLLANGFEMYEASAFIDVIGWNKTYGSKDIELFSCGLSKSLKSAFDIKVKVDFTTNEINPEEFIALAIPGGFEDFGFYDDGYSQIFCELIRNFHNSKKIIASICVGALPLGKSGILQNRKATTYHLMGGRRQKQLEVFGARIINEPIVEDDNIITSWAPFTAVDVAFRLLEYLTDKNNANYMREIMGFRKRKIW